MIWGMTSLKNGDRRYFGCAENQPNITTGSNLENWSSILGEVKDWSAVVGTGRYYGDAETTGGIQEKYVKASYDLEKLFPYFSSSTLWLQQPPRKDHPNNPLYKPWNLADQKYVDGVRSKWMLDNGVIIDIDTTPRNDGVNVVDVYSPDGERKLFTDFTCVWALTASAGSYFAQNSVEIQYVNGALQPNLTMFNRQALELRQYTDTGKIVISSRAGSQRNAILRAALYQDSEIEPPKPVEGGNPFGPDTTPSTSEGTSPNRPNNQFDIEGEFNDPNDMPDGTRLPPDIYSCTGTQFLTMYAPSYGQLAGLATKMWDATFLEQLNKAMANPFEAIISLHLLPFKVKTIASQNIKVGNKDTNIIAPIVASQYQTFDFGEILVPVYSGTYLDYSPYTSYNINLPFLGEYQLDPDLITGKTLHLKYHVDILTGDTVAVVSVDGVDVYTFTGNCATQLPLTQGDYTNFWRTSLNTVFTTTKGAINLATGNTGGAIEGAGGAISSAVSTVFNQKPTISSKGVIGSNFGNFCCLRPYLTKRKPNLLIPDNQQSYTGWASYYTTKIGDCTGFNQFKNVILTGFDIASDTEKTAVKQALSEGVII